MLTKRGIKIKICSLTMKETQHQRRTRSSPEPLQQLRRRPGLRTHRSPCAWGQTRTETRALLGTGSGEH